MSRYKLRPYQEEAVETINSLPEGSKSVCCLATGLGKTLVASQIDTKGRVLWLSHRDELVRQPEKYFADRNISFGIEKADESSNGEKVVSASVQSLSTDKRLHKFSPDDFEVVVVDEAHHAIAPTYRKILDYFKPKKLLGLTATPQRGDKVGLTEVFDDICFVRDLKWGIKNNYLAKIRCLRVSASFDMKKAKKTAGDFTASSLSEAMIGSDNACVVAKTYVDICYKDNRQTLIYCPTVEVCEEVCEEIGKLFPQDRNPSVVLHGKVSTEERRRIIDGYNSGKIKCIVNCMILTEGTDLVTTGAIICDRPSANPSLYQQIVGRGTRICEGKDYCLIIDIIGKNSRKKNICTAPTLFGLEPDELSDKVIEGLSRGDLLENVESLQNKNRNFSLVVEMYDAFSNERIGIVGIHAGEPNCMRKIAEDYERLVTESIKDYDFGDLIVHTTPDCDKYYCIRATYEGNIYLSKPDMLNQTRITFDIPNDNNVDGINCKSQLMKMEKAVKLIKEVLTYYIPSFYSCLWSKTARLSFKGKPATEQQIKRVEKDYYKRLGAQAYDRNLSKYEASSLIELASDINENVDTAKKYRQKIKAGQSEEILPKEVSEEEIRENYEYTMKTVLGKINSQKKFEKKICLKSPDCMNYRGRATEKQLNFIGNLYNGYEGVIRFNTSIKKVKSSCDTMTKASAFIDLLLQLKPYSQNTNTKTTVDLNSLISTFEKPDFRADELYIVVSRG